MSSILEIQHLAKDRFVLRDGSEHSTWGAARKALTRLDLIAFIEQSGIPPDTAAVLADRLLSEWRISSRNPTT